jgi:hypothetical protein
VQSAIDTSVEKASSNVPQRKKRIPLSFLLAGIAVLGAILYLVFVNTQASAAYYMTVTARHVLRSRYASREWCRQIQLCVTMPAVAFRL